MRSPLFFVVAIQLFAQGYAQPRPFTKEEKAYMLMFHNDYRRAINSIHMQCFYGWNDQFEERAQKLADSCKKPNSTEELKSTAFFSTDKKPIDPALFTSMLQTNFIRKFNYEQNKCADNSMLCWSGFQMLWHEGGEIGCGRSKCGTEEIAVCVYQHQARFNLKPFIHAIAIDGQLQAPCTLCSSKMPFCYNDLCCIVTVQSFL